MERCTPTLRYSSKTTSFFVLLAVYQTSLVQVNSCLNINSLSNSKIRANKKYIRINDCLGYKSDIDWRFCDESLNVASPRPIHHQSSYTLMSSNGSLYHTASCTETPIQAQNTREIMQHSNALNKTTVQPVIVT